MGLFSIFSKKKPTESSDEMKRLGLDILKDNQFDQKNEARRKLNEKMNAKVEASGLSKVGELDGVMIELDNGVKNIADPYGAAGSDAAYSMMNKGWRGLFALHEAFVPMIEELFEEKVDLPEKFRGLMEDLDAQAAKYPEMKEVRDATKMMLQQGTVFMLGNLNETADNFQHYCSMNTKMYGQMIIANTDKDSDKAPRYAAIIQTVQRDDRHLNKGRDENDDDDPVAIKVNNKKEAIIHGAD